MSIEEQLRAEVEQLRAELKQLREDYELLEHNFDIMSEGYEQSLELYDTLQETYHELEETNRELEIARQRAEESSRMKTNFIQQISHEIRTPLNILNGFTQILTTPDMELDATTQKEVTQGIDENTNRITGLINKMLELADAGSQVQLERNDVVPAIQIAAQATEESGVAEAPHLLFDIQMGDGTEEVILRTNLQQATRALTLLLDNARKFTSPAEASVLAGASSHQGNVKLALQADPQSNIFSFVIEDNGILIPAEEAERIFEEFVQLDDYYDGTGIGLTVARSIARRLGGDIYLDTSFNLVSQGARFVFTLPMEG